MGSERRAYQERIDASVNSANEMRIKVVQDNFFVLESVRILNLVMHLTVFSELEEMVPVLGGIILAVYLRTKVNGKNQLVSI